MSERIDEAKLISLCQALLVKNRRTFVAIVGAPGSGKSTLVERLADVLTHQENNSATSADGPTGNRVTMADNRQDDGMSHETANAIGEQHSENSRVAILPMDGYHYDDNLLKARGRHQWKGAPDTFDVGGLRSTLTRLADTNETSVAVPVFDRDREISRGSARIIPRAAQLILVEGNYLLLDQAPWASLHSLFDLKIIIDVSEEELAQRLRRRWVHYGLNEAQIATKLNDNDLPNGRTVRDQSVSVDYRLVQ